MSGMEAAVIDVQLDCAFALYYFHGRPKIGEDGVISWAKRAHPAAFMELVVKVGAAITSTLEKHALVEPIHSPPEVEL